MIGTVGAVPFEDDSDDEWPPPDRLLPPEDRLWRHPSEVHASKAGDDPAPPASHRSATKVSRLTLVGVLLAGATAAFGIMWVARPAKVTDESTPSTVAMGRVGPSATPVAVTGDGGLLSRDLATTFAPSVARVEALHDGTWTTSSALWIDDAGTLVTPAARVATADEVMVVGRDGTRQPATVAGTDEATALAALVVGHTSGTPVAAATRRPVTGERVAAIGCGVRDRPDRLDAVTMAAVLVRSTDQRAVVHGTLLHDVIHVDRALPSDVDGGGLVDPSGRLLGLILGNADDQHLGTVIPAATAIETARTLRIDGRIERAWLGVQAVDVDPAWATMLDITGGARLTEVTHDSPAAHAGLRTDDVVVAVGHQPIDDASDLVLALRGHAPGSRASITVRRGSDHLDMTVVLGG